MAVSAYKTFVAGEVLTASDLNSSFAQFAGSNGQDVGFPRTAEADFNGQTLYLDADKDSSFSAGTVDDRLDLALQGTVLFRWDGATAATPVNGLDFIAADAGSEPSITAHGADTDIDIDLIPKGTGVVAASGGLTKTGNEVTTVVDVYLGVQFFS